VPYTFTEPETVANTVTGSLKQVHNQT